MAQHKAPTAVTIAATSEKSGLALLVEKYWKLGVVVVLAVTGFVIFRVSQAESERQVLIQGWDSLMAVATRDPMGALTGSPDELKTVADRESQSQAAPWALFIAAKSALEKRDYEAAKQSIEQLRTRFPSHPLVQQAFAFSASGAPQSAVDVLSARIDNLKSWTSAHAALFDNPPPPADAPKVRLNTDKGTIVVQLYPNLAPKHVENFLKLAREGFYAGTKFHAVRKGSWIQGGDPNTKEADVTKWGQGATEAGIEREKTGLSHFAGYLSMWKKPGDAQSSGCQFLITTAEAHSLDGQNVVFGKVIEGTDVVAKIEGAKLVDNTERPEDPTTLQSVEVP